jgi:hypothetical protein
MDLAATLKGLLRETLLETLCRGSPRETLY